MIKKSTHIGVYSIIIKNDKIALIKKANGGYKDKLDLPGGGIERKETPLMALHRELMEEAGTTITKAILYDATSTNIVWHIKDDLDEDLHHIGILYLVEINGDQLKETPDGFDSNGAEWYLIKELTKEQLSPFAYYALHSLGYLL